MKIAEYWKAADQGRVQCELCPHGCVIAEAKVGRCRVRGVQNGELVALGYGVVASVAIDPMEKKPLHHFLPGEKIFSLGGWGCNLACVFCQNWSISQQFDNAGRTYRPEDIVEKAVSSGTPAIAYTYNEPLIGFEFVRDCAKLARAKGLKNVLVTNGFIRKEPAAELLPMIDALNIDIKSMDDEFYRKHCKGLLQPVLDFTQQAFAAGCHVEITNLIVTGLNDRRDNFERLADWLVSKLGRQTVLHLSAYHPDFNYDAPPTEFSTLETAYETCRAKLDYVYVGNVVSGKGENTECPSCRSVLVSRRGYSVKIAGLSGNKCAKCGRKADMVL